MTVTTPHAPPLTATYRLQLHAGFTFDDARAVVPYLARLGVSHVYLSPVVAARPGSTHGYDVADPRIASPELGGEAGFRALAESAHAHGLGVIVDIVPNHMGIGPANPFWMDVLRWGRESRFAGVFDIEWDIPGRDGLLLLPVLGDDLDTLLTRGDVALAWRGGELRVVYFEHEWPLDPRTVHRVFAFSPAYELSEVGAAELRALREALFVEGEAAVSQDDARAAADALGAAAERSEELRGYLEWVVGEFVRGDEGRHRMQALLGLQRWRLAHWRRGSHEINYRRFFDVGELAAVRVEDPAVFDVLHGWVLDRVAERLIDGLRIDHIDGLRDPQGYLERLRIEVDVRRPHEALPILVEKILSHGEQLPATWATDGTTGYEFLNEVEALFVDPNGLAQIERGYRRLLRIGESVGFADVAVRGKELVLRRAFDTDVRRLVRLLAVAARAVAPRLPRPMLHEALIQLAVGLPVYRTYLRRAESDPTRLAATSDDYRWIGEALAYAQRRGASDRFAVQFVADVLRGEWPGEGAPARAAAAAHAVALRFQQTSGPATAKGVEDTALYRWFPLASLGDVGGDPARDVGQAVAVLHARAAERAARWRRQLLAVDTHDTKRTGDLRARLDALSEIPNEWLAMVGQWRRRHAPLHAKVSHRAAPDTNAEYLLYQTLVGVWPADGVPDAAERASLRQRVAAYVRKAAREAKAQTSWTDADAQYEQALDGFVAALVDGEAGAPFRAELDRLVPRVARAGWWTSLARTVVHATSPGTPDVYQGSELWSLALVDPDNRRPVDYERRRMLLDALDLDNAGAALMADVADGRIKLHVLRELLQLRRGNPALFARGDYAPVEADGARARQVVAFVRQTDGHGVLVVVPRLVLGLSPDGAPPTGATIWLNTSVRLPILAQRRVRDVLTGLSHEPAVDGTLSVGALFDVLPVACLIW